MTAQLARNLSLEEMDKESMLHPFTSISQHMEKGPHIVKGGKGVWVTDAQGNEYIDTMAGLACVNIGWGRDEVVDAMAAQARELAYYQTFHGMSNEPAIRLADRLLDLVPGDMARVAFGCSGSDANDTQVKLVRYFNNLRGRPEKKKIISRHGGYHGTTLAAASLTGLPVVHKAFDLPMAEVRHTETPHYYQFAAPGQSEAEYAADLAAKLEEMIVEEGPETVAAFIAEPVMGSCGMILPPEGYFAAIQEVLRRHEVLMIADEVICGFGRTGRMFGCERYGIEPDMVTIAKGLTSAYVPMSASLISNEIWKVIEGGSDEVGVFAHGVTYGAHPVCAAAALANLDIIEGEDGVYDILPARSASDRLKGKLSTGCRGLGAPHLSIRWGRGRRESLRGSHCRLLRRSLRLRGMRVGRRVHPHIPFLLNGHLRLRLCLDGRHAWRYPFCMDQPKLRCTIHSLVTVLLCEIQTV